MEKVPNCIVCHPPQTYDIDAYVELDDIPHCSHHSHESFAMAVYEMVRCPPPSGAPAAYTKPPQLLLDADVANMSFEEFKAFWRKHGMGSLGVEIKAQKAADKQSAQMATKRLGQPETHKGCTNPGGESCLRRQ